ncbi:probable xyloglucan endotransglucosylase/hydrolase protein 32 [Hibiscus syriacus]|uniref:probable xyloglucan endotransglucosylase/hydrolase protein 32 n=1 Tax=Hibiscus syriacus TaxID=106335 RepID=UPI00192178C3|nr:probable xyloglucan endotransglucosylase/hydrolase protein 32 [Hibiscus syriacus]
MALFLLVLVLTFPLTNAEWPLSPGYWPSSEFRLMSFHYAFKNLWGFNHQSVDQNALMIWLDRSSGSGFKSNRPFRSGYFGASIKVHPGYTADRGRNRPDRPTRPTAWFLNRLLNRFLVDDVPIRRYPRKGAETFPLRPMWLYGSIWDASSRATEDGKYKADYDYQPFVAKFTGFKAGGCSAYSSPMCRPISISPFRSGRLTGHQCRAMR